MARGGAPTYGFDEYYRSYKTIKEIEMEAIGMEEIAGLATFYGDLTEYVLLRWVIAPQRDAYLWSVFDACV